MLSALARNWWVFALRGALAILLGLAAVVLRGSTIAALVLLFAAYLLTDGIFAIVAEEWRAAEHEERGWLFLVEGLAGVAAGSITFTWSAITAPVLLYIITLWAILTGVLEVLAAAQLRREIEGENCLAVAGMASLVFGELLLVQLATSALPVVCLIGAYGIVFGIAMLALALRLRTWWHEQGGEYHQA